MFDATAESAHASMKIRDLGDAPLCNSGQWRFLRVTTDDYAANKRARKIAEAELSDAQKRNFPNIARFGRVSGSF